MSLNKVTPHGDLKFCNFCLFQDAEKIQIYKQETIMNYAQLSIVYESDIFSMV